MDEASFTTMDLSSKLQCHIHIGTPSVTESAGTVTPYSVDELINGLSQALFCPVHIVILFEATRAASAGKCTVDGQIDGQSNTTRFTVDILFDVPPSLTTHESHQLAAESSMAESLRVTASTASGYSDMIVEGCTCRLHHPGYQSCYFWQQIFTICL